jgi:CRP-like cAMP-binding protein
MTNIKQLKVVFQKGHTLFEEGDCSKEMYILLKGGVEVSKSGRTIANIKEEGSFIGEMATLLDAPRSAKVITSEHSVFLKVEPKDVDILFKVTPELGYSLSKSLAQRLTIATENLSKASQSGSDEAPDEKERSITEQDIEVAEKSSREDEAPNSANLSFLTRTEVHKDVFRYWFNHLEMTICLEQVITDLDFTDTLIKLILRELQTAKLIKVNDGKVHFLFEETFQSQAEDWIFTNGLFRSAG